ncbi:MAG: DNA polymerase III subunit beta, partial [Clostridiaceae bacterium]
MKFICEKFKLQDAISIAQKAITGKSTMPILEGIYLNAKDDRVTLIGSDVDVSIETVIDATVVEKGAIVVDAKIFGEIIRKLPNDLITIETLGVEDGNNIVNITCKKSVFNLIHMNPADFPDLPVINETKLFSIPQNLLKNMIKGTSFAIAQDETRPILQGILFEVNNSC